MDQNSGTEGVGEVEGFQVKFTKAQLTFLRLLASNGPTASLDYPVGSSTVRKLREHGLISSSVKPYKGKSSCVTATYYEITKTGLEEVIK